MTAILNVVWREGVKCRDCSHKYTDRQYLEYFGTPCTMVQNGCHVEEGQHDIAECPGVRRAMEGQYDG